MKRITIRKGNVALVTYQGEYKSFLSAGKYWLRPWLQVTQHDMSVQFASPIQLNILLEDANLSKYLDVIEVGDQELVIVYKEGNFERVLTPGRYAYWKGLVNYKCCLLYTSPSPRD